MVFDNFLANSTRGITIIIIIIIIIIAIAIIIIIIPFTVTVLSHIQTYMSPTSVSPEKVLAVITAKRLLSKYLHKDSYFKNI